MFNILTTSSFLLLLLSLVVFSSSGSQKHDLSAPSSICNNESACNCTRIWSFNIYRISCNFSTQDYTIDANSLPTGSYELEIIEGGNIIFESGSFSKLPSLGLISVQRVRSLLLKTGSFVNLLSNHLRLEISDATLVEIESRSFYLLKGPVSYNINKCFRLTLHNDSIPWIQNLNVSDVAQVDLLENSLLQSEKKASYHQGYTTRITLHKVSLDELPKNSFPSFAAEIKLSECKIKLARENSFSAIELYAVHILNSSFDVIETGAFSERSLLRILQLSNVKIHQMQPGAILSAVINFTISSSNIDTIETQAFNMSATTMIHFANNEFFHIKENGITLRSWTKATIENNTLRDLQEGAINVLSNEAGYFHFVNNKLEGLKVHSLKLMIADDFLIKGNTFIQPCRCDWPSLLETYIQTNNSATAVMKSMYTTSYCSIISIFAKCFQNAEDHLMQMVTFNEHVCHDRDKVRCLQQVGTTGTFVTTQNSNILKAVEILNEAKQNQERAFVSVIATMAVASALITFILTLLCAWLGGNEKYRAKCPFSSSAITNFLMSLYSRFAIPSSMGRATSANSITPVSVHEYAEIGPATVISNVGDGGSEDRIYICEDKATQTLPEELTQELLQTLRDKLDDPQDYTEARNMIEHLYDLIKVEECCNNNTLNDELDFTNHAIDSDSGLVYDVITPPAAGRPTGPRVRRYDKSIKKLANKGTRLPSPDKLSPRTFTKPSFSKSSLYRLRGQQHQHKLFADEYAEPCDRRDSNIYSDLMDIRCSDSRSPSRHRQPVCVNEYIEPHDFIIPIYSELDVNDNVDVVNAVIG